MAKVKAEQLGDAIAKILDQYGEDVRGSLEEVTKKVAQAGVKQLRSASASAVGGSGKYAKGWAVTTEFERLKKGAIIYHKSLPGLPHLLEYGHITKKNGKRYFPDAPAHPHIEKVESDIVELYEREVVSKLQ
jgi:hypothetical protein